MIRRGPPKPIQDALREKGFTLESIKEWRERESKAGNRSSVRDFYEAHNLCFDCHSTGERVLGSDGVDYINEACGVCGGTGRSNK